MFAAAPGSHSAGRPSKQGDAMPATRHEDHHDMIADFQIVDAGPEFGDDAGRFVPQAPSGRPRPIAVDDRQIGMAQSGRGDLHQNLARPRWIELDPLDRQWLGVGIRGQRRRSSSKSPFGFASCHRG